MRVLLPLGILALALSSCAQSPVNYVREPTVPTAHAVKDHPFQGEGKKNLAEWWAEFADPSLQELLTLAKTNNYDLALARERLREVSYSYGLNETETEMQVAGPKPPAKTRVPGNTNINDSFVNASFVGNNIPFSFSDAMNDQFNIHFFSGSFGIDLFNVMDQVSSAAKSDIMQQGESANATAALLRNQIGKEYINLRFYQNLLQTMQGAYTTLSTQVNQLQARVGAGLNTNQDLSDGQDFLRQLQQFLIDAENNIQLSTHNLSLLTGITDVDQLNTLLETPMLIPVANTNLLAGTPIETVKNRADLRAKFHNLQQASSQVNVAVADQFPALTINASLEASASALLDLLSAGNLTHMLGVQLSNNFLNTTNLKANIRVQKSKVEQAQLDYNKSVHSALTEVANAMVNVVTSQKKSAAVQSFFNQLQTQLQEATTITSQDGKNLPNLISTQKDKIQAEIMQMQSTAVTSSNMLDLLTALGG